MGYEDLVKCMKEFMAESDAIELVALVDRDGLVLHADSRKAGDEISLTRVSSAVSSLFSDAKALAIKLCHFSGTISPSLDFHLASNDLPASLLYNTSPSFVTRKTGLGFSDGNLARFLTTCSAIILAMAVPILAASPSKK